MRSSTKSYVFSVVIVVLTALLKAPIESFLGTGPPLILFVPAITLSAWSGGLGAGLLASTLSTLICCYFYFTPFGSFRVSSPNDQFRLLVFGLQGLLISVLMERLIVARRVAEQTTRQGEILREQLEKSERLLRSLMDHSTSIIWIKDLGGRYLLVNRLYEELSIVRNRAVLGKTDFELFPREVAERAQRDDRLVFETRQALEFEVDVDLDDGPHTFSAVKFPLWNAGGDCEAIGGFSTDITAKKQAERTHALLAAIVESSDDAIIGKDLDGVITSWNSSAERLYGFSAEDAIGRPISIIIPPERLGEETEILDQLSHGQRVEHFETVRRHKDGTLIDISLTVSPVRDSSGRIVGASKVARDITEKKQAEKALRDRTQQLELALRIARMGVFGWNLESNTIKTILGGGPISGLPKPHYPETGEALNQLIHESDRAFVAERLQAAIANDEPFDAEFRIVLQDTWMWVATQGQCTIDAAAGTPNLIGVDLDITERKQVEEVLQAHEALQRRAIEVRSAILNALPAQIAMLDSQGVIVSVNEKWRSFGVAHGLQSLNSCVGENYVRVCEAARGAGAEGAAQVAQGLRGVLEGKRSSFVLEYPCHSPSERRWFRVMVSPIHDGSQEGAVVMHVNITERILAEEMLRKSHREQQILMERLVTAQAIGNVGSWESIKGTPEWIWSRQTHRIFETDPETFHPNRETFYPFVHPDDRETFLQTTTAAWNSNLEGHDFSLEFRVLMPDGRIKNVEERWRILRDSAGQPSRAVGTCQDITDRKRAEAILARSAERMETLSRRIIRAQEDERRRIARELHDELGQSLTALKINLQEVDRGGDDVPARLEESFAILDRSLQQVRGMALDLRPSLLDDLGLVAALDWYIARDAQRTGLVGRLITDPENIRADPEIETVCFRVCQEALTNIARHAHATRFSVELLQHSSGLQLVIRDDGQGFDPESKLKAASQGVSFGLCGMRERVELVGGEIQFISKVGEGTEIQVELPNAPMVSRLDLGAL